MIYCDWYPIVTEEEESFSYSYNMDGIRTSKNVNGVYHEYLLNGSQIIGETWEEAESFQGNLLLYLYNAEGERYERRRWRMKRV